MTKVREKKKEVPTLPLPDRESYETVNHEYGWGENSAPHKRKNKTKKDTNRGKGPKGFERTDERLKEHVSGILTDDTQLDASGITVDVKKGDVKLTGKVETPKDKQRAKGILDEVSGISKIENKLQTSKKRRSKKAMMRAKEPRNT